MPTRQELLRFARENRQKATKSELLLWRLLKNQQLSKLKFRRQHVIEPYVVDFACISEKLILEIDGDYHEFTSDEDAKRQRFLESLGWRVLRFSSEEVESNTEAVLAVVMKTLAIELQYDRKEYMPSGMMKPRNQKPLRG